MTSYRHSDDKNYFHSYFGSSCHSHYDGCYYSGYRYNGYRYFVRHLCAMILVASFLGCGGESSSEHRGHLPDGPWLTVTDGLGRQVEFPHPPKRVVSLAPKNTELMFAIGAGEQLVGATTYCNYPPPSRQLPKVGGFSPSSVSLETLIDLQPDMVLSAGDLQRGLIDQSSSSGSPWWHSTPSHWKRCMRKLIFWAESLNEIKRRNGVFERCEIGWLECGAGWQRFPCSAE
jgi:hypothetical protein